MATRLNSLPILCGLRKRVTMESSVVLTPNCRMSYPRILGCVFIQPSSNNIVSRVMNIYSDYNSIPAYLKKRRGSRFSMKDKKKILPPQILRRKQNYTYVFPNMRATRDKITSKMEKIIERENIWTIPNILCVSRILVCPYLGYLILQENYRVSCYLLAFAGITDFLDGYIARKFKGQSSKLGSFLDPLADKVLVSTVFVTLSYNGAVPLVLTALIVARDVSLAGAGFYIRFQSLPPPKTISRYFDPSHATAELAPTAISKLNTCVQLATICVTLSAPVLGYTNSPYVHFLWWLTGLTTVWSAGSYIFSSDTYRILKEAKRRKVN